MMKKTIVMMILVLFSCLLLSGCTEEASDVNSRTPEQEKAYKELFNSNPDSYFEKKPRSAASNES